MKFLRPNWLVDDLDALVVFATAIVRATPIVILAPFVFAAPVLVFTPVLARSIGPESFGHVKTGFARNLGYLKGFPEASSLASRTFSPSTCQLFWLRNTRYECYARQHSYQCEQEQSDQFPSLTSGLNDG